jgi:hypothetical protein
MVRQSASKFFTKFPFIFTLLFGNLPQYQSARQSRLKKQLQTAYRYDNMPFAPFILFRYSRGEMT